MLPLQKREKGKQDTQTAVKFAASADKKGLKKSLCSCWMSLPERTRKLCSRIDFLATQLSNSFFTGISCRNQYRVRHKQQANEGRRLLGTAELCGRGGGEIMRAEYRELLR